ncbi:MAG TPA: class I SAM-dependent methyltransferase [Bacteroidales bacterium]|nr:class I SAM-dependent methyltransferase [Bacteroidales bacterium]
MSSKKFDVTKLNKLNNPERIKDFPLEFILEHLQIKDLKVIIDLGAGTGFYSIPFASRFKSCKIYACDISDTMIDWMKDNVVPLHSNIITVKMGENNVPLHNEMADLLFMVNLHHELDNPEKILKESYRVLKSNGSIAISDWRKEASEHGPSIDIRYAAEKVEAQLKTTGFKNIRIFNDFPNNFVIIAEK